MVYSSKLILYNNLATTISSVKDVYGLTHFYSFYELLTVFKSF